MNDVKVEYGKTMEEKLENRKAALRYLKEDREKMKMMEYEIAASRHAMLAFIFDRGINSAFWAFFWYVLFVASKK